MSVSLSELRRRFFDRMDEGQSQYITPAQANDALNEAYAQLWGIYAIKEPRFFHTTCRIQPANGVSRYALPNDFRMLTAAYVIASDGSRIPMRRLLREEYVSPDNGYVLPAGSDIPAYELYGTYIELQPAPGATPTYTVELWYAQHCIPLKLDDETLHVAIYPGHEQWIINQAVIMIKIGKEEQPAAELMGMNGMLRQQIEADLTQRDRYTDKKVLDCDDFDGWVRRGWF